MRNKILIAAAVLLVLGYLGWFGLKKDKTADPVAVTESAKVETKKFASRLIKGEAEATKTAIARFSGKKNRAQAEFLKNNPGSWKIDLDLNSLAAHQTHNKEVEFVGINNEKLKIRIASFDEYESGAVLFTGSVTSTDKKMMTPMTLLVAGSFVEGGFSTGQANYKFVSSDRNVYVVPILKF